MTLRPISRFIVHPAFLVAALIPSSAFAHPGHYHPPGEVDEFDSFAAGFMHPWSGLDHLLLAFAVGWITLSCARRSPWLTVIPFFISLVVGAIAGHGANGGPLLEISLASSLILAGFFLLRSQSFANTVLPIALASVGLVHGFAHGSEAMKGAYFAPLTAGLLVSTFMIFLLGHAMGHAVSRFPRMHTRAAAGCGLITVGALAFLHSL